MNAKYLGMNGTDGRVMKRCAQTVLQLYTPSPISEICQKNGDVGGWVPGCGLTRASGRGARNPDRNLIRLPGTEMPLCVPERHSSCNLGTEMGCVVPERHSSCNLGTWVPGCGHRRASRGGTRNPDRNVGGGDSGDTQYLGMNGTDLRGLIYGTDECVRKRCAQTVLQLYAPVPICRNIPKEQRCRPGTRPRCGMPEPTYGVCSVPVLCGIPY